MSAPTVAGRVWDGAWVAGRLDIALRTTASPVGVPLDRLVGLAVRDNPRRAHLLVSTVLGKHVPTDPCLVYGAGLQLGLLAADALADTDDRAEAMAALVGGSLELALSGDSGAAAALVAATTGIASAGGVPTGTVVVGYAETATALGHAVADALDVAYLHSTRRRVATATQTAGFEEEHSHATSHLLLPEDPALLCGSGPLVLVDDELSTGSTVLNTIAALHGVAPRERYLIASLVDLRSAEDRARMAAVAETLGARIDVVALAAGEVDLPPDILERGRAVVAERSATVCDGALTAPYARPVLRSSHWPATVREGGRHGFTGQHRSAFDLASQATAQALAVALVGRNVLVLGSEELMYAPLRIAMDLQVALGEGASVRFSTTTRSPVLPVDEPGYAIRTRLAFPSHDDPDDGPGSRYAYNVVPPATAPGLTDIVLVLDAAAHTAELDGPESLLAQLQAVAEQVHVVVLPAFTPAPPAPASAPRLPLPPAPLRGPDFGSYAPDEVAWLLTDLSAVELEAPTEEREEAIQSAGAHYAESLPLEYQPTAEYQSLFAAALSSSATRLAHAVGVVTELTLAARGEGAVLASLARAGTPVGVLMRRWAREVHGIDLPHYAVSIVRGRGLDRVALAYLAAHHDPASVMFVDGWTGKGAIAGELAAAVAGTAFRPELAVLADPGSCVEIYGTREDFLIASACLNSTVSGLVSRTVLNDALIGPGQFHGAKFYDHLAPADVSGAFLDAVSDRFADVRDGVAHDWPTLAAADRTPTWAGWAAVEEISAAYGIDDVNLVKPGVGETTRVLLRRVPWRVLVRPDAVDELGHVLLLAAQRGVPVEEVPGLAYSSVGLIHPRFTRGATGADGTAAAGPR